MKNRLAIRGVSPTTAGMKVLFAILKIIPRARLWSQCAPARIMRCVKNLIDIRKARPTRIPMKRKSFTGLSTWRLNRIRLWLAIASDAAAIVSALWFLL